MTRADSPSRRRGKGRWWLLPAVPLLLLLVVATVDLRPATEAREPVEILSVAGSGALRVGAGKVAVGLPADAILAGYRPFGRRAEGEGVPTYARSVVLEAGGVRTAIVLLELMTLPPSLVERIAARVRREGIDCALSVASHTHSGPGGYDRALLPQAAAIGPFDSQVEEAILAAVSASLISAQADLGPARWSVTERRVEMATNRDRPGAPVDDRLTRLDFLRPDGRVAATLLRIAAHPTLSRRDEALSGDWPGLLMEGLERRGGVALVLQGAVGDARADANSPSSFATELAARLPAAEVEGAESEATLACAEVEVGLPPPDVSGMVPSALGRLVNNLAIPFAPEEARLGALRLGPWTFVGIPAEPTAAVAARIEAHFARNARVVALAQGYAGYAIEAADVEERVFSWRQSWFGAELSPRLVEGSRVLAELLAAPKGRAEGL